mgnify:CR=1 FL=1
MVNSKTAGYQRHNPSFLHYLLAFWDNCDSILMIRKSKVYAWPFTISSDAMKTDFS